MRIAFVTDVHLGPEAYFEGRLRKLSHRAVELTRGVVSTLVRDEQPDLLVNLGDVLEDQDLETDRKNYRTFVDLLAEQSAPVLHVAGNHDTVHLDPRELSELWGQPGALFYSTDCGPLHLCVLHSIERKDLDVSVPPEQLAWLRRDLAQADRPTVLLVHHPLSDQRLEGNPWFEKAPHICRVSNRKEIRTIIAESGKVCAVLNGHAHWNHLDVIDGIPYITLQSLTENLDADAPGRPARAYAVVDVDARRLLCRVFGEERARYQHELPAALRRLWPPK